MPQLELQIEETRDLTAVALGGISNLITFKGSLAQATPALANRLIKIALDEKTRGYTSVSAIQTAFAILQSGIIDRENKSELKKLRELIERLEENLLE